MTAAFDIVIPTYNNRSDLSTCLESIAGVIGEDLRVLVCVDGSTDGTIEYLAASTLGLPVSVLQHADGANHGRAAARNLALPHLQATFVLLLDSDMRLEPQAIARHRAILEERDCVSVGDVVYLNEADNAWARYQATRGKGKSVDGAELRPLDFNTQNVAMRRVDLVQLEGFDPTLTGYGGEDTELGLRLAELGRAIVFNKSARALTVEDKSISEGLSQLRQFAATNLRTIRARHPDAPAPFWVDRLESRRWRDRALRAMLNPLTDLLVELALPRVPWAIQRRLLSYRVIRAVFTGYREGAG